MMQLLIIGETKTAERLDLCARAVDNLRRAGFEPSTFDTICAPSAPWHRRVGFAISTLDEFNGIAVLPNSDKSLSTKLITAAAKRMSIPVMSVLGWTSRAQQFNA